MQSLEERSHSTTYLVVSHFGNERKVQVGKETRPSNSKVVIVLSNYHFNRDQQSAKFRPCTLADCTVGVKYSSSEFAPRIEDKNPESKEREIGFNFDKFGLLAPYVAFASLLTDKDFAAFVAKAKTRYGQNEQTVAGSSNSNDNDGDDNNEEVVEEDDEFEEEAIVVKKTGKKRKNDEPATSSRKKGGQ